MIKMKNLLSKVFKTHRDEKREVQRVPIAGNLYLEFQSLDQTENGTAQGKNISNEGLCFASDTALPYGTKLDLKLRLSPFFGQPIPLQVRVVVVHHYRESHQNHFRIGTMFDQPDPATHNTLQAFISWLKEREAKSLFPVRS